MGSRRIASLIIALIIAAAPSGAEAQRIVTPSSGIWSADTRGSAGTVAITGVVPRSGNGSLQLGVTGDLNDWAFFNLFAPNQTAGWGQLEDLTHVQFDWLRSAHTTTSDPVWEAQSPVLRLYIRSGLPTNPEYSELVWERWYNLTSPTPTGSWQTEDMTNQVFWRFVQGSGYTIGDCTSPPGITPGVPIKTASPGAWANGANCYLAGDAVVYGVGVGLGSNWPHAYEGFIDNVQLGFNGQLAVNDNFELESTPNVTPEPATLALLATGLAGIGGAAARRRRRPTT
jgi:hypothetical protein